MRARATLFLSTSKFNLSFKNGYKNRNIFFNRVHHEKPRTEISLNDQNHALKDELYETRSILKEISQHNDVKLPQNLWAKIEPQLEKHREQQYREAKLSLSEKLAFIKGI